MKIKCNSIISILSITNRYYILNKPTYNTDYFSIFELIKRK